MGCWSKRCLPARVYFIRVQKAGICRSLPGWRDDLKFARSEIEKQSLNVACRSRSSDLDLSDTNLENWQRQI